jgi:transposase
MSGTPETNRSDRRFCTRKCKQKDHRKDVKAAKEMRARGKSIAEIAQHFQRTHKIIKNWLVKKK